MQRGIFFGWYIVAATFFLYVLAGGPLYWGFGVFFRPIVEEYSWSRAATAVSFSLVNLMVGTAPLWGWFVDRFGARVPMVVGTACMAVGYLILSQLDSLLVLNLGYALAGLGWGVYVTAPIAVIGNWFRARRALAMGVAMSGYGLSGTIAPVLNWGIEGYGWRAVYVACAIATLVFGVSLSLVLRHRPELYGFGVDGNPAPTRTGKGTHQDVDSAGSSMTAAQAMRTRAFWLLALIAVLNALTPAGLLPHMVTYLTDVGFEAKLAALTITGITIATIMGRIGGGALSDRLGKRPVLVGGFFILAVSVLIFAVISQSWQLLLFVVLAGPSLGAVITVVPALTGDYFGPRSLALIIGLVYIPRTLLLLGVPSGVGWVFDRYGTYRPAWLVLAGILLVAAPLVLMLRPPAVSKTAAPG